MATLSSIRKQISALEKKAEELVKKESAQAIAKARELIERYGLTAESLGLVDGGKKASKKAVKTPGTRVKRGSAKKVAGVPMYRDPETGKTWTGRGKPPAWIAGAQDRSSYLITPSAATATEQSQPATKKSRATKKPGRGGKRANAKSAAAEQNAEASAKTTRRTARKASSARAPAPKKAAGRKAATKAARNAKPVSADVQSEGGSVAS